MGELEQLRLRVKACRGPDTGLDEALWDALHSWPEGGPYTSWRAAASAFGWDKNLTGSLDAALALGRRVIGPGLLDIKGGWNPADPEEWPAWTVTWYPRGTPIDGGLWHGAIDTAPTPALALLATIIEAKSRLNPSAALTGDQP